MPKGKRPKAKMVFSCCEECNHWQEVKDKLRISELLASAAEGVRKRITTEAFKPTLSDYLKLIQMEHDCQQENVKELTVTWVEPETTPSVEK